MKSFEQMLKAFCFVPDLMHPEPHASRIPCISGHQVAAARGLY